MEMFADQMLYSVELADTVDESRSSVHDSLEPIKLVLWSTGQQTVTVAYSCLTLVRTVRVNLCRVASNSVILYGR